MGYGKIYSPSDTTEYKTKQMVLHLVALHSHLMINRPVIMVSHDFSTLSASRFALSIDQNVFKRLFFAASGIFQPDLQNKDINSNAVQGLLGYDAFGYQKFFSLDLDAADLIENNPNSFLDIVYSSTDNALGLWRLNFSPTGELKEWLLEDRRLP